MLILVCETVTNGITSQHTFGRLSGLIDAAFRRWVASDSGKI